MAIASPSLRHLQATVRFRLSQIEPLVVQLRFPRSNLTPEEKARRAVVAGARRALRGAERRHSSAVRSASRGLRRAERAHDAAVRSAEKALRDAERTAASAIARAEHRLVAATSTRELGRYGALRLFEDRIDTGGEVVLLVPGFRAFVGPVSVVARAGPEPGIPHRILGARGARLRDDRMYLALEGGDTRLLVEAKDERAARAFAGLVDVAVLNVDRVVQARRHAGADHEREVADVRRAQAVHVERARGELEVAVADRDRVDAAARALADAEADTDDIVERREALATVEGADHESALQGPHPPVV